MSTDMFIIPKEVISVAETLKQKGFESFLVGGCVRDLFLQKTPKDWDIATNATPEEIIACFEETFYENTFGTVGVVTKGDDVDPKVKVVEVTPYREESDYTNNRHPDKVSWSKNITDDLKRRDFTVNALAMDVTSPNKEVIDLFEGKKDLQKGILKTVGKPEERFQEDGLRILRAVRLSTELGFTIEKETEEAIRKNAKLLERISKERIRDEFTKIIASKNPAKGIEMLHSLGLLTFILPELEEGIGKTQRGEHIYDVYEHSIKTLEHAGVKEYETDIRLASLLHDIGKPRTRRLDKVKNIYTFFGHEVVGARMAKEILERLKYSNKTIERVTKLVRWHMFFSDTDQITLSAVRRMIQNVGEENIWDLMNVRICDRIGTGRPKEDPYRLRKYHAMIEEALRDPISVKQLKIDGTYLMEKLSMKPGPKFSAILHILLEEVIDDPKKNTEEYLANRAKTLDTLPDLELKKLGDKAKETKEEEDQKEVMKLRSKHKVK